MNVNTTGIPGAELPPRSRLRRDHLSSSLETGVAIFERNFLTNLLRAEKSEGLTGLRIFQVPAMGSAEWFAQYGRRLRALDLTIIPMYRPENREFEVHVCGTVEELERLDRETHSMDRTPVGGNPVRGVGC